MSTNDPNEYGLSPTQWQMYCLGHEAREKGYGKEACNILDPARRSCWLCGWGDADIEIKAQRRAA